MSVDTGFDLAAEVARVRSAIEGEKQRLTLEIDYLTDQRAKLVATLRNLEDVDRDAPADPPPLTVAPDGDDQAIGGGNVCPHCGRTFETPHGLAVHRARSHGRRTTRETSGGRVVCSDCGKTVTASNLERHRARKHGPAALPAREPSAAEYRCDDCGRTFPSGSALGGHRKVHMSKAREGPKVVESSEPMERRSFDPDRLRDLAGDGIDPNAQAYGGPAQPEPKRVAALPDQQVCGEGGCTTILSRYNESGKCSVHEASKTFQPPKFARGLTG